MQNHYFGTIGSPMRLSAYKSVPVLPKDKTGADKDTFKGADGPGNPNAGVGQEEFQNEYKKCLRWRLIESLDMLHQYSEIIIFYSLGDLLNHSCVIKMLF